MCFAMDMDLYGINGRYDASYNYTITPSTGTVAVHATTYCWHVTGDDDGNAMDTWIPAPPEQLKTAYSVYLRGPGSPVGVVELPPSTALVVYPSPVTDILNVHLPGGITANSRLDVLDITGRIVLHRQMGSGTARVQLNAEPLAQGTYCVRLSSGAEVFTTRFMKQ